MRSVPPTDAPIAHRPGAPTLPSAKGTHNQASLVNRPGLLAEMERDVLSDKPLADVLRKCLVLGGKIGSVELRQWASRELRGYQGSEELPDYRIVGAGIYLDGVTINTQITGQQISPRSLPDFTHKDIHEYVDLRDGIGSIEALIAQAEREQEFVKLSLPMAADLASFMTQSMGNPYQRVTALYWKISPTALRSVVDQVRTTLTELIVELRAGTPDDQDGPPAAVANQAVNVVVHGRGSHVNVTTAQAASEGMAAAAPIPAVEESRFWTRSRRIGAFIVGVATVIGTIIAIIHFTH